MKRILSVVCALALMLCAFPFGVVSAAGTEEDPIEIQAIDTIETDGSGDVVYYVYNAPVAGDYTVTITGSMGVDSFGVNMVHPMTGMEQETWAMGGVLNLTATAQMWTMNQIVLPIFDWEVETLTITIEVAKGTWSAPETLVIGENTAKNPDNDYYYYTWTAEETGTLTITMPEENWAYNGYVTDPETLVPVYFADWDMTSADETVVNPFTVDVMVGDQVSLMVQTLPDAENWGAVYAGEVPFTVAFDAPTGAQDDPVPVKNGNTVTVGAGETKYFVFEDIPGVAYKFNVMGATGFMVGTAHPMMGFMMENPDVDGVYTGQLMTGNRMSMTPGQAIFTITNNTEEAQEYTLSIVLPVGTMENPEELALGETAFVSEDGQTYYYKWTAEEEGTLTFMINTDACTAGWYYAIVHNDELVAEHTSNDGCNCSDYAVDVLAGDVVNILVNNYDYAPGETVVFTTEFLAPVGTVNNPIPVEDGEVITTNGSYNPVYYAYNAAMPGEYTITIEGASDAFSVLTTNMMGMETEIPAINGKVTFMGAAQMWMMNQVKFGVIGTEVQDLTVSIKVAVGTFSNPDTLVIGENVAKNPDNDYYYYTWTPEADGTLTITMPESNWAYNGYTLDAEMVPTYFADWDMTSADETVVNPFTVDVKAGEEVRVMVQTLPDAENWGAVYAGEVAFTVAFTPAQGSGDEPMLGDLVSNGVVDIADATLLFRAINGRVELTDNQKAVADVNGDGLVDIADATMIFRFVNGRITSWDTDA